MLFFIATTLPHKIALSITKDAEFSHTSLHIYKASVPNIRFQRKKKLPNEWETS